MTRKQELLFRLLSSIGFVLILLILPVIAQRCGLGAPPSTLPAYESTSWVHGITAEPPSPTVPVRTSPPESPIEVTTAPELEGTVTFDSPLPQPTLPPPDPTATRTVSPDLPTPTSPPIPTATSTVGSASSPPDPTATGAVDSPLPQPTPTADLTRVYSYRIVNTYPHDPEAFTQGLVYFDGFLYEGTGLNGRSSLRRVELETGEVLQSHALSDQFFGEGIAIMGESVYQLTWLARRGFVYDLQSFEQTGEFSYPTQGWGLTHDGTHLIMSDGTPALHFLDPETFEEARVVEVQDQGKLVQSLNELEYVKGVIYANVWKTNRIARIDPESGEVIDWIDLSGLLSLVESARPVDVLNGIAYDPDQDRLFVTGKLWPNLFEIEVIAPEE